MTAAVVPRLSPRLWTALIVLGSVGQVAWTVENMYLNVFVYDTISDDPGAIAAMVAASALAATLATMLIGALSDRAGRRRAFISAGYVLWGLVTAAFGFVTVDAVTGLVPAAEAVLVAVAAVIVLDCLMSFLGAGANDAAFQAWVTDVTHPGNRGRVESVLAIMPLVSMLAVFGGFDSLTRAGNWRLFFLLTGAVIVVVGVASWFLVRDRPAPARREGGYLGSVVHGLRPAAMRADPGLYLALAAWSIWGISTQVFLPYLIIYVQRYLHIEAYAVVLAVVLTGASAVSVGCGRYVDRIGKIRFLLPAVAVYGAGLLLMAVARGMGPVIAAGLVMMSGFMLVLAPLGAIVRDYSPPGRAGQVQGLRMIFAILIPMIVGPSLGAVVIKGADEYYEELGVLRQVPTPAIFLAAAAVLLLIVVPVLALRRRETR
ncbi:MULTISPECIES: MFS transporter [Streptosporangium]|uniref:MFS family permease n=1 Tax=Streptosporangium brasiliense TaxID=47480 RepID=A0ABT9QZ68_9ACTN|nr:MFS transporter [Streptosporangium brasiliense]MDP9862271.1 MFS family permease [Streptosporangium brasiliense]